MFNEGGQDSQYWEPPGMGFQGLATAATYIPETSWNEASVANGLRASGGGASALFAKPSWQTGPGVPADSARDVPDLAFGAATLHDPYLAVISGQLYAVGGTSISAPLFAGIVALTDQSFSALSGVSRLGNINPSLYYLANQPSLSYLPSPPPSPFHDVTTGNNNVPCLYGTPDCVNGLMGFNAGPGYDQVTGLGSLNVSWFISQFRVATTTTLQLSTNQVVQGGQLTMTATVRPANTGGPIQGLSGSVNSCWTLAPTSRPVLRWTLRERLRRRSRGTPLTGRQDRTPLRRSTGVSTRASTSPFLRPCL